MQKISEEEIKGLEAEIDSAIDRLFVDKNGDRAESVWKESRTQDSSYKEEGSFPRPSEPSDESEFSFPPIPGLSDEPDFSFSDLSATSYEKEVPFSRASSPSRPSAFSLSDPSKTSYEKAVSFPPSPEPSHESDFFLSRPSNPSNGKEVSDPRPSKPSHEKEVSSSDPSKTSYEMEITFAPSSESAPLLESIDRMETQLLSLEWEITKENLRKTREEVVALRESSRDKPDVTYVLSLMEKVLDRMIRNDGDIRPPMIKFLLDAKETVKLLLRQETSSEISTYKQLAYTGIETRFSCLNTGEKSEESSGSEAPTSWSRAEGLFSRIGVLEEKMEGILRDMEVHLTHFRGQRAEAKGRPVHVTVFKVDEKLLGVESGKVLRLFKVPNRLDERYFNQGKVRLKEFEARIIDLRKILSIQGRRENQDVKILMVRENGEYKGLMVDQVIKNLSASAETDQEQGEYFSETIHWTYQEHPVEIPILDLKKLLRS